MKKTLALLAVVALVCALAVGGTLAYLQDDDYAKNTMTVGKVTIVQNERDRYGSDINYDGTQKLLPAVYTEELAYDGTSYLQGRIWDKTINNELDKFVTVTNTGTEAAYIRTIFAFEDKKVDGKYITEQIHTLWNLDGAVNTAEGVDWPQKDAEYLWIKVDGVDYTVCVYTYAAPIAAGETTNASLCQLFLNPAADNSFYENIGEKYDILVLSQAVQAQGFEGLGAKHALNTAFGEVSVDNAAAVQDWFVKHASNP